MNEGVPKKNGTTDIQSHRDGTPCLPFTTHVTRKDQPGVPRGTVVIRGHDNGMGTLTVGPDTADALAASIVAAARRARTVRSSR